MHLALPGELRERPSALESQTPDDLTEGDRIGTGFQGFRHVQEGNSPRTGLSAERVRDRHTPWSGPVVNFDRGVHSVEWTGRQY